MKKVWYRQQAGEWLEALPLGNGFMGMMLYGSVTKERICFNEGTLWSGYPKDHDNPESLKYLDKVRELIFAGKNHEADVLCSEKLKGAYSEAYMPLGDVLLDFEGISEKDYTRSLDLSQGVHEVKTASTVIEAFCSNPDDIGVYQVKSNVPFSVNVRAESKLKSEVLYNKGAVVLCGHAPDYSAPAYLDVADPIRYNEEKGMAFALCADIYTDGRMQCSDGGIKIDQATELTIYFAAETGFIGFDKMPDRSVERAIENCRKKLLLKDGYEVLKTRHVTDISRLFDMQSVSFGSKADMPTDELINAVQKGADETALCELFYNFGKYLLIAGSRPGGQILNLQGLWNEFLRPPWSSNYTVNINTEMNYWGASRVGLSECIEPLVQMMYEVMLRGKRTARINYGSEGFCCNHNIDLWRKTAPVQGMPCYMIAPLCGAWLVNEICGHLKNGELEELRSKIQELVTESARFASDFLVLHDGYYVTCPSTSPENNFYNDGEICALDYGSAFDMAIIRELFGYAMELSDDEKLRDSIKHKLPLLLPYTASDIGICEWHTAYDTPENGHRHFSPLYGFYPGSSIGFYGDREKTGWIEKLFRHRLDNFASVGDYSSKYIGWSAAWAICISARLRDKNTAREVVRNLLCNAIFDNLFCVHPPHLFQIDGNFGFIAAINELLLTEENGVVELLPTLPDTLKQGSVRNMVVNGCKLSFSWENGKITKLESSGDITVRSKNISDGAVIESNIRLV